MAAFAPERGPAPRLFSTPPSAPFLPALAQGLLAWCADDAEALADTVVLLPTRRAARALGAAFLDLAPTRASLLPRIRPIGDVAPEEALIAEDAFDVPDAIADTARAFELARLVQAKDRALGRDTSLAGALAMADALGKLIDDAAIAEIDGFAGLKTVFEERLPAHLQEAARFLEIVDDAWPRRLAELGVIDPARRRSAMLNALAERWRRAPPPHRIVVAGSTGATTATARLIGAVAQAPLGVVVLPGLDADLDEAAWADIGEAHPQGAMKRLLALLGADRASVRAWPGTEESAPARARRRLINEALRPAERTADWLGRVASLRARAASAAVDPIQQGAAGMALIEARNADEEAGVVGIAVREQIARDSKSLTLVVTPDLALARRIQAKLVRWDIAADLSAGLPLDQTDLGGFCQHVLDWASDPADPVAACAVWKSPFCTLGRAPGKARAVAGDIERWLLRGVRPAADLVGLREAVLARDSGSGTKADALALIDDTRLALEPFMRAPAQTASVASWAQAHARALERFADTPEEPGAARLWRGPAGAAAAGLLRDLIAYGDAAPAMALSDYRAWWGRLAADAPARPVRGGHPNVLILGPLEARLLNADFVVLAGLNEGVWPSAPGADPLLSRAMRRALGLPAPERGIGLSAHDFAQLLGCARVLLTRSERSDAGPAVASRWVWRLKTLLAGALGEDAAAGALDPDWTAPQTDGPPDYRAWVKTLEGLDQVRAQPAAPPAPKPPVERRPARLSVTQIRTWVRDPYALYAAKVLRLERLRGLDEPAGPRERGEALHAAMERLAQRISRAPSETRAEDAERIFLEAIDAAGFAGAAAHAERLRAARAAAWALHWDLTRRAAGWRPGGLEIKGELRIDRGLDRAPFVLAARADRLDEGAQGWAVIDFKTGAPPSLAQVRSGFEPQLPLEAAMLAAGGFPQAPPAQSAALIYVRLSGGPKGCDAMDLCEAGEDSAMDLAEAAMAGLTRLIRAYDDPDQAYLSQPRPQFRLDHGDYDLLARRGEWATGGEAG